MTATQKSTDMLMDTRGYQAVVKCALKMCWNIRFTTLCTTPLADIVSLSLDLLENNFEFDYKDAVKFVDADDNKTCSVCLKKCKDKYARVKHENTVHTNEPQKYQCDLCARSYSSLDALSYHVAKKHQVSVQKYSCDLCGSQFATLATLARHKKIIHDGENSKQFECEFCSKTFSLASNMKRHEQELHFGPKLNLDFHEGLEPAKFFQCETCEKKFTRKRI